MYKSIIYLQTILLATAMLTAGCNRSERAPASVASSENSKVTSRIRFDDGSQSIGINFLHNPTRTAEKLMPEIMGSGVAIVDLNRDGAPDIVLINGGAVREPLRPSGSRNQLYINDGHGRFIDKTDEWKLPSNGFGMGVAAGDFDNDGWIDLFLTSYRGDDVLLRNTGNSFEDVTQQSGITSDGKWSTSAGFFDLEGDGDLDLWTVRYVSFSPDTAVKTYRDRTLIYSTPVAYDPLPDRLLRNNGNGTFTDVSKEAGLTSAARKGLALAIGDIDLDGDLDIYVANDTNPNQLWINDGRGGLKESAQLFGVAYSEAGAELGNMGADFSDINNDQLLDIVCTTFQTETTSIYRQEQPMLFREVSDSIGIGETARAHLKFGVDFFDADNDGDEDLIVANGHVEDNIGEYTESISFAQQTTLYENLGNGKFSDISDAAGVALQPKLVGRGLATGDLDGDGDLDFIIATNGGKPQIGINVTEKRGNFVGLWLEGVKANRSAIGARIVTKFGGRSIQRQIMPASSYLSVCDFRVLLGVADATSIDELTIFWPGREPQIITNLGAGKYYRVVEGQAPVAYVPGEKQIAP
jgi:enediyne biosynthesis protein E4